ncbi:MAG: hypothetical protein C5B52_01355 [Bacteroidetes bacterium]|nr:MAG: hypothetical protein C5B52_01355 [Bacteroidota bacterium]
MIKSALKKLIGFSFLLIPFFSRAQEPQFTGWLTSFNSIHLHKFLGLQADAQIRSTDQWKALQLFVWRLGVTFKLNKHTILGTGYINSDERDEVNGVSGFTPEQRAYQEIIVNHKIFPVNLLHRLKIEERFIPQNDVVNGKLEATGHVYSTRLCYLLRSVLPLQHQKNFEKGFYLVLQNDIFFNLTNLENVNGYVFDLNRLSPCIGRRFNPDAELEIGYINQAELSSSKKIGYTHILQCTMILRLNNHSGTSVVPVGGG